LIEAINCRRNRHRGYIQVRQGYVHIDCEVKVDGALNTLNVEISGLQLTKILGIINSFAKLGHTIKGKAYVARAGGRSNDTSPERISVPLKSLLKADSNILLRENLFRIDWGFHTPVISCPLRATL